MKRCWDTTTRRPSPTSWLRESYSPPCKDVAVWKVIAAELLRENRNPKAHQHAAINIRAAHTERVIKGDNLGNARVVYDKFHFIHNEVGGCDQVRKAENRLDVGRQDLLKRRRWMSFQNRVI
jgi:hypothetical protein